MIVKEEQSNYLTGYVINPSGQIIMDIGLHPDGNIMTNALENLFGFDLNKDGFKGGLNEGITWMDEIHIAKMLGFETFEYNPGNTDLFVDFSSDYQYIYFAPSEITYDSNGFVIYEGYKGTSGPKNYLKNSNGTKYILDQNYIPVAIEVINDLSNGIQF